MERQEIGPDQSGPDQDPIARINELETQIEAQDSQIATLLVSQSKLLETLDAQGGKIDELNESVLAVLPTATGQTAERTPARSAEPQKNWFQRKLEKFSPKRVTAAVVAGSITVGAILGAGSGVFNKDGNVSRAKSESTPAPHTSTSPSPGAAQKSNKELTYNKDLKKMTHGLKVVTGNQVDMKHANDQRGPTAFGDHILESPKQVKDFIHSDTKGGQAIRSELAKEFKGNPDGLKRAENGTGYRAIQIKQSGVLKGTTYLVNGKVHTAGDRAVKANDVMWTYVNPDGHIDGNASIRAACDQPGFKEYVPTPSNVSVTPIEQSTEQTSVVINEQEVIQKTVIEKKVPEHPKPEQPTPEQPKPEQPTPELPIKHAPDHLPGPDLPNDQDPLTPGQQEPTEPQAGQSPANVDRPVVDTSAEAQPPVQPPSSVTEGRPDATQGAEPASTPAVTPAGNPAPGQGQGGSVNPNQVPG